MKRILGRRLNRIRNAWDPNGKGGKHLGRRVVGSIMSHSAEILKKKTEECYLGC